MMDLIARLAKMHCCKRWRTAIVPACTESNLAVVKKLLGRF